MRWQAAILLPASLVACSVPDRVVTVEEVRANIIAWHNEVVTIEGWLGQCGGLDCAIYPNREDAILVASGDYRTDEWRLAMERRVSIGFEEKFDAAAAPLEGTFVRLTGRLDRSCAPPIGACTDRAPEIHPIDIVTANSN